MKQLPDSLKNTKEFYEKKMSRDETEVISQSIAKFVDPPIAEFVKL
jgi:hypothetical protein